MNIFVAKLNRKTTTEDLKNLFGTYGEVISVKIIYDKSTGLSKGYGFVEMAVDEAAELAIQSLNESTFQESEIVAKPALPREERPQPRKHILRKASEIKPDPVEDHPEDPLE